MRSLFTLIILLFMKWPSFSVLVCQMTQLFCFSLSTSLVVCSTAPEMKQLLSSAKFWPLLETWRKESLSFWLVVVYPSASEAIRKKANLTGRINLHTHVCCGTGISLRVVGLTRIKLHPEYQSLGRSSFSLVTPKKWNTYWELKIVCISMLNCSSKWC